MLREAAHRNVPVDSFLVLDCSPEFLEKLSEPISASIPNVAEDCVWDVYQFREVIRNVFEDVSGPQTGTFLGSVQKKSFEDAFRGVDTSFQSHLQARPKTICLSMSVLLRNW